MKNIKMFINEKEIPLNPIMSTVLTNIINGFIDALKNIPKEREKIKVEITL